MLSSSMPSAWQTCQALHYSCAILPFFLLLSTIIRNLNSATTHKTNKRSKRLTVRNAAYSLLILSYISEGILTVIPSNAFFTKQATKICHLLLLSITWTTAWLRSDTTSLQIWTICLGTLLLEVPLMVLSAISGPSGKLAVSQLSCQALRISILLLLVLHQLLTSCTQTALAGEDDETRPCLEAHHASAFSGYGTHHHVPGSESDSENDGNETGSIASDSDDDTASIKRRRVERLKESGGWWGYLKDFSIFLPFLIPRKDRKVQLCIVVTLLTIVWERALNVLIPRQLGIVADQLLAKQAPFKALGIWLVLSAVSDQGASGLIRLLASIPIKQFSYRQVTNAAFNHVITLSMDFHSDRDSAEVMKAIEQGESLTDLLETLISEILPTLVDLAVAFGILYWKFNVYAALIMGIAATAFIVLEVAITSWNVKNRRESSKAQREEVRIMHQAIQGWQTVTYFNMFDFERRRFGQAVDKQLAASRAWAIRDEINQSLLDVLSPVTFFTLASLVVYEISQERASPGDLVFLIQYWSFLVQPLKYLSWDYRNMMSKLIDAERLLYLFQTKSSITDKRDASELLHVEGHVAFEHVSFAYDSRKQTLQDLSLSITPGQTLALVGETGAGKSSIVKLLLRFYDVSAGCIKVDGCDIRDMTLSCLRNALGVVPQDPLLFNASIRENLRYARPSATDEEIYQACRAAAMHDKILSFADGYETRVGEQGVKLSGGEIQRLAIARVFLKNPPILILDEATSAVDTNTEYSIQLALDELKRARSTLVIAHRLSTIVSAHRILVIHDGRVVEAGTHGELIEKAGRYRDLWNRQVSQK